MSEFKPIPLTETQMAELFRLRQRVAELEKESSCRADFHRRATSIRHEQYTEQIANLSAERDSLKQQRDELLAALEQFATWGRMQHKAQSKGCHATFDMMSLKDEIDLAEAAIASVKEK